MSSNYRHASPSWRNRDVHSGYNDSHHHGYDVDHPQTQYHRGYTHGSGIGQSIGGRIISTSRNSDSYDFAVGSGNMNSNNNYAPYDYDLEESDVNLHQSQRRTIEAFDSSPRHQHSHNHHSNHQPMTASSFDEMGNFEFAHDRYHVEKVPSTQHSISTPDLIHSHESSISYSSGRLTHPPVNRPPHSRRSPAHRVSTPQASNRKRLTVTSQPTGSSSSQKHAYIDDAEQALEGRDDRYDVSRQGVPPSSESRDYQSSRNRTNIPKTKRKDDTSVLAWRDGVTRKSKQSSDQSIVTSIEISPSRQNHRSNLTVQTPPFHSSKNEVVEAELQSWKKKSSQSPTSEQTGKHSSNSQSTSSSGRGAVAKKEKRSSPQIWTSTAISVAAAVMNAGGTGQMAETAQVAVLKNGQEFDCPNDESLNLIATKVSLAVLSEGGDHTIAAAATNACLQGGSPKQRSQIPRKQGNVSKKAIVKPSSTICGNTDILKQGIAESSKMMSNAIAQMTNIKITPRSKSSMRPRTSSRRDNSRGRAESARERSDHPSRNRSDPRKDEDAYYREGERERNRGNRGGGGGSNRKVRKNSTRGTTRSDSSSDFTPPTFER